MSHEIHDHYFHQAKREGYRSRAAYKLKEINDRKKIFTKGDAVLDCGCAPGSWLQVAEQCIGPRGVVIGIDLNPLPHSFQQRNIHVITGDLNDVTDEHLHEALVQTRAAMSSSDKPVETQPCFDVILSDMAPKTTGQKSSDHHASARLVDMLFDRCRGLLEPGGNLVVKVFEGERSPDLLARARQLFDNAKGFKPQASRQHSTEMYIVAKGYIGATQHTQTHMTPPPRPKPRGWGG